MLETKKRLRQKKKKDNHITVHPRLLSRVEEIKGLLLLELSVVPGRMNQFSNDKEIK